MNERPAIDVVIVTRNNETHLRELLDCVIAESRCLLNVFIVDDASEPNIERDIKTAYPEITYCRRSAVHGPAENRNKGAAYGSSDYIVFLDDDALPQEKWFIRCHELMQQADDIGMVGGLLFYKDNQKQINSIGGGLNPSSGFGIDLMRDQKISDVQGDLPQVYAVPYCCSAAIMVRRSAFEAVGGFDDTYFYMSEDLDLSLRFFMAGYRCLICRDILAYHGVNTTTGQLGHKKLHKLYTINCLKTMIKVFSINQMAVFIEGMIDALVLYPSLLPAIFFNLIVASPHLWCCRKAVRSAGALLRSDDLLHLNQHVLYMLGNPLSKRRSCSTKRKFVNAILNSNMRMIRALRKVLRTAQNSGVCHATIHLTTKCNLKCPHCFVLAQNPDQIHTLSLSSVEDICCSLGHVDHIVLTGGEPFLYNDLITLCQRIDQLSSPKSITIPTNGILVDKVAAGVEALLGSIDAHMIISFSLDGPEPIHNQIRGHHKAYQCVTECYQRLEGLLHAFAPRLTLQCNAVVTKQNEAYFDELIDVVSNDFPHVLFSFETSRGGVLSESCQCITAKSAITLIEKLRSKKSLNAAWPNQLLSLYPQTLKTHKQLIPCVAGVNMITIWADGTLAPCEILNDKISLADYDWDVRKAMTSQQWQKIVSSIQTGKCYCSHGCSLIISHSIHGK